MQKKEKLIPFNFKSEISLFPASLQIESKRLTLEPVSSKYEQEIFTEFTPEITTYMFPKSPTEIEEVRHFIEDSIKEHEKGTGVNFVILEKTTKDFLGICGIYSREKPEEPEIGIWIKKSAHGNKFGREAIETLINWSKNYLEVTGFLYPVDRNNFPSRKIPEAFHGKIIKEIECVSMSGKKLDEVIYRIPANYLNRDQI